MQTIQHTDKVELAGRLGKRNKYTDKNIYKHSRTELTLQQIKKKVAHEAHEESYRLHIEHGSCGVWNEWADMKYTVKPVLETTCIKRPLF